jgi:Zn-dependent protease with chaperone function
MRDILVTWVLFGVSNIFLAASVPMLWTGKLPNGRKVSPVLSTAFLVIGMTGLIFFGKQDLLKQTIGLFQ